MNTHWALALVKGNREPHVAKKRGVVNDWFSSYLCGRGQTTEVEMTVSAKATTPWGSTRFCARPSTLSDIYK